MKYIKRLIGSAVALGIVGVGAAGNGNGAAAASGFSDADVNGRYGFSLSGYFVMGKVPVWLVGTGQLVADGRGHLTGSESFSLLGTQCAGILEGGTYKIHPDGTGTVSATYTPTTGPCGSEAVGLSLVLYKGGSGLKFYSTSEVAVTFGDAQKQ
jgi:hypothetical protein